MVDYDMVGQFDDPTLLLLAAGQAYGVPSILKTTQHPLLMTLALKHALYQADVDQLGHQGFDQRAADIMRQIPGSSPSEIAAVSWGGQTPVEAAADGSKAGGSPPGTGSFAMLPTHTMDTRWRLENRARTTRLGFSVMWLVFPARSRRLSPHPGRGRVLVVGSDDF